MPARHRPPAPEHCECIVVGAGALGLATAWSLSRRGREVLVLEAFDLGHPGAGSRGTARIFRGSYPEPHYAEMAALAHGLWRGLETEAGRTLLVACGLVNFGDGLDALASAMSSAGLHATALSTAETATRFEHLAVRGPSLFERDAGVLVADECLRAFCDTGSFTIRTQEPVRAIGGTTGAASVDLKSGARIDADVVVNCAGHRAPLLLAGFDTPRVTGPTWQQVVYLNAPPQAKWPAFIEWGPSMVYGLPIPAAPRLKLAQHVPSTSPTGDGVTGDGVPGDDPQLVGFLRQVAERLLPQCAPEPVATERCVYDNTTDGDFVLDRVGNVVVGFGTSGHGFKFAPLLGEVLADLATGAPPRIDMRPFALSRSDAPPRRPVRAAGDAG